MATNSIIEKVTGTDSSSNRIASTFYCTCSTAAATAQKNATPSDSCVFNDNCLITGVTVHVKFTNSNTHATPTLKVGTATAKQIMAYGTTKPGTSATASWYAGAVVSFTYDGTYWLQNDYKIDTGEVNQNAFSNVKVGSSTITAESKTDTLELVAGDNITLTPDTTNDTVTIAASDTNDAVTQTNDTATNSNFRILFSNSANDTTETAGVKKSGNLLYNPYENKLSAGNFQGTTFNGGAAVVGASIANTIIMQYEDEQHEIQYSTLLVNSGGEYSGQLIDWLKPIARRGIGTVAFSMANATYYNKLETIIPANGMYIAISSAEFASKANVRALCGIYLDNGNPDSIYYGTGNEYQYVSSSISTNCHLTASRIFPAKTGDKVYVCIYQSSGGALNCTNHSLTVYRLSPFYGYWPT